MIQKWNDYTNESVRSFMKPKSDEEIRDIFRKRRMTPGDRLRAGVRYDMPDLVKKALYGKNDFHSSDIFNSL